MYFGAIEGGGTKFRCAVLNFSFDIIDSIIIKTTTPIETLSKIIMYFKIYRIKSIGIGSFGPINLDKSDKDYGMITSTPKLEWQNFNIYQYLEENLNVKLFINTDVVTAAIGEYYHLKQKKINNLIYITVGTGIGAGVIYQGKVLQGMHHSEMGHFILNRRDDDKYASTCQYHSNCLEGLASGVALNTRYNLSHTEITNVDEIWDLEGYYLAQAIYNYTLTLSPQKIIIGGGVSNQKKLFTYIKKHFIEINNKYFNYKSLENIDDFIISPTLKGDSGIVGAAILAAGEEDVC